jgi:acyl dehydratase
MTATLAAFAKGHQFPPLQLDLSERWVRSYVEAVEDTTIGRHPRSVPPMALAALAIGALLKSAGLPEGAVHVAQELSFARSVRPGEALTASARVLSRGERQGWILMGVDLTVADDSGISVMDGRATLTFPAEAEA